MPNIKENIQAFNNSTLEKKKAKQDKKPCNCRRPAECPMNGECREKEIVYRATVTTDEGKETYIGMTENEFKTRYTNHKQSFKKPELKSATELSKYVWHLKEKEKDYKITWEIVGRANSYNNRSKKCNLCLLEKYYILFLQKQATLNKKSELVSTCRHARKFLLCST